MPYEMHWHDTEHSIIRLDMTGKVTWEGWYRAVDEICAELEKTPHRVDVILYDSAGMPKGNPMPHVRATMNRLETYDNLGRVVNVSARNVSVFVKTILSVVMRVMNITSGRHGIFVDTLDEAIAYIEKDRQEMAVIDR